MGFLDRIGGKIKDIFTTDGPSTGDELVNTLRGVKHALSPSAIKYMLGLRDTNPYAPDPLDTSDVQTPEQARDAIDRLLGVEFNSDDRREAEAIDWFKNQGGMSQFIHVTGGDRPDSTALMGMPFTTDGDAMQATGQFPRDPAFMLDLRFNEFLQDPENQALGLQYLRTTQPMDLLPDLVGQVRDMRAGNGNEKGSNFLDYLGRPFAAAKDISVSLLFGTSVDRMEETFGDGFYYNSIPDPYLRQVMAKRLYDFNVFEFWDQDHEHEREALRKIEDILARDGMGTEAGAEELERYLKENNLGGAGIFSDIMGKILVDPLWVLPAVGIPVKITKGLLGINKPLIRFGGLSRLFTPAGRSVAFSDQSLKGFLKGTGVRALMNMPELSYQQAKLAVPAKGLTRLLFERTAPLQGHAARTSIELRLAPVAGELSTDLTRIEELGQTLLSGKPTAWVEQNLPGFLDQPVIAQLSAASREAKTDIFESTLESIRKSLGAMEEAGVYKPGLLENEAQDLIRDGLKLIPPSEMRTMVLGNLSEAARTFAEKGMQDLWASSQAGRFLQKFYFPLAGMVRSATAAITINNPGFVFLNVVSNGVRLMWHAGWHPRMGAAAMGRSLTLETGTLFRGGGRYPEVWERMLKPIGLTPLDVERNVSRVTGSHDLLGRTLEQVAKDPNFLTDDAFDTIRTAMLQPGKEIGARSRLIDKFMAPVYVASRVDKAFRRAFFMSNLQKQYHLGTAPGGVFSNLFGPMRNHLQTVRGMTDDQIDLIENGFADEIRSYVFGTKNLPKGKDALDASTVRQVLEDRVVRMESGDLSAQVSASEIGRKFAKEHLGLDDIRAQTFATHDLAEFIDFANDDLLPMLRQAQVAKTPAAFEEAFRKIQMLARQKANEYDVTADAMRQVARLPRITRGATTYSGALRVTNEGIRREMVDTFQHLDRLMGVVKGEAWSSKKPVVWQQARELSGLAENAITENVRRLGSIQEVYDRMALETLEQVGSDTVVPAALLDELIPEDIRTVVHTVDSTDTAAIVRVSTGQGTSVYTAVESAELSTLISAASLDDAGKRRLAELVNRAHGRPPPTGSISDALQRMPGSGATSDAQIHAQLSKLPADRPQTHLVPVPDDVLVPKDLSFDINEGLVDLLKRVDKDGNTRAVAVISERGFGILKDKLYAQGTDLGALTTRELLQNAVDAVRHNAGAKNITLRFNTDARVFEVIDNGIGLLPDQVTKEFIDIGDGLKTVGDTGGFGFGLVPGLANSDEITLITRAIDPDDATRLRQSTLSGSSADYVNIERGLLTSDETVDIVEGTGTTLRLRLSEEARMRGGRVSEFVSKFNLYSKWDELGIDFQVKRAIEDITDLGGSGPFDVSRMSLDDLWGGPPNKMTPTSIDGSDIHVDFSSKLSDDQYGSTTVIYLNEGVWQWEETKILGEKVPAFIRVDLKPTVTADDVLYPFSVSRQDLQTTAREWVNEKLLADIKRAGESAKADVFRRAWDARSPVGVEGAVTGNIVMDMHGTLPPAFVKRIAGSEYTSRMTRVQREVSEGIDDLLEEVANLTSPDDFLNTPTGGFGLQEALGSHTQFNQIIDDADALILTDPFQMWREAQQMLDMGIGDDVIGNMAKVWTGTLYHENLHRLRFPKRAFGGDAHDANYAGALTRLMERSPERQLANEQKLLSTLRDLEESEELVRFIDDFKQYQREIETRGDNLFGKHLESLAQGDAYPPARATRSGSEAGTTFTDDLSRSAGRRGPEGLPARPTVGGSTADDIISVGPSGRESLDPERSLADIFEILEVDQVWWESQVFTRIGAQGVPARRAASMQQARLKWIQKVSDWREQGLDDGAILDNLLGQLDRGAEDSVAGASMFDSARRLDDTLVARRSGKAGILDEQLSASSELDVLEDFIAQWSAFPEGTLLRSGPDEVRAAINRVLNEGGVVNMRDVQRPRALQQQALEEAAVARETRAIPIIDSKTAKELKRPDLAGKGALSRTEAGNIASRVTDPSHFWELVLGRRLTTKEKNIFRRFFKRQEVHSGPRFSATKQAKARVDLEALLAREKANQIESLTGAQAAAKVGQMNPEKFSGPAFRVDSGFNDPSLTVADVIRHERDEVGNPGFRTIGEDAITDLEQLPSSKAVWVTRTEDDAARYLSEGQPRTDITQVDLGPNAVILADDGPDGGFLVLRSDPPASTRAEVMGHDLDVAETRLQAADDAVDTALDAGASQDQIRHVTQQRNQVEDEVRAIRKEIEDTGNAQLFLRDVPTPSASGGAQQPPGGPPAPPGGRPPPPPPSEGEGMTVGQLWENYFNRRDRTWDDLYAFIEKAIGDSSEPHLRIAQQLRELGQRTGREHRNILQRALAQGDSQGWQEAGESVRNLYQNASTRRGTLAGWGPNDPPKAMEGSFDAGGVLARELHEFAEFFVDDLKQQTDLLLRGERSIETGTVRGLREAADLAANNWPGIRDTMIANAKLATDFGMLNYLDQTGGDRLLQAVFPFEFWPTRDAFNWGIRGAKAPGAFGALMIMMFNTDQIAEQYGYPQRLQNRVPIPIPGLGEFLDSMPVVGKMLEDGDFAPMVFVDPMRFIFPYTFLREGFDNDQRRNTPAGRALDFFNNNTPLNAGPFQTFIGRNVGLLDKDAWRSSYLSGGPFGLPTTEVARRTARFVFGGDEDAIPEEEQNRYQQTGSFGPSWLRDILGMNDDAFSVYRAERALASMVATGELMPDATKEEQLEAAWIAIDSHEGPVWRKAVSSAQSEQNLRRLTHWIGFPFGDMVGVNEGEMIWFGLKGLFAEASRTGQLGKFYEKFPEFEIRSAAVRGLSDPEEKEKAIDTELYYQSLERFVNQPFEHQVMDMENERERLRQMEQLEPVRDQLKLIEDELRVLRDQQEVRRGILDRAFPFRETELSINRSPRERVLREIRSEWFDLTWEEGEPFEAFTQKRENFLAQFPAVQDRLGVEMTWAELEVIALRTKILAGRQRDLAFTDNKYERAQRISDERDAALRELHGQAREIITRQDVERYLGSFAEVKTAAEKEFDNADAMFDFWMSLVGDGSLFSGRERSSISTYFRSQPEIQKYFPLSAVDLDTLTTDQRLALMRRRDFWRTYHSIRDSNVKLDYLRMMKPELDRANRLLGLPPIEVLDIDPYPAESGGDPLFDHIAFMAAMRRQSDIDADETLSEDERRALGQLSGRAGFDPFETALTDDDVTRYITPYTTEEATVP